MVLLALVVITAFLLFRLIREPRADYERASRSNSELVFTASDTLRTLRFSKLGIFIFGAFFCGYALTFSFLIISSLFKRN